MDVGSLLAALALGFVCGAIARALIPNDAFQAMSGWKSWVLSTVLGLLGALVGYFIFTELLGIGDEDKFDWGGVIGALIGSVIVVALASWLINRYGGRRARPSTASPRARATGSEPALPVARYRR